MIYDKFIRRAITVFILVACFAFLLITSAYADADVYGSISIKNSVPVAPDVDPKAGLPNNIRFFKNNTGPSPIATGLGVDAINTSGTVNDALYTFKIKGTITLLIDKGMEYGRTSYADNMTTPVVEGVLMEVPGGAPKAYQLLNNISPWYLKQPPPAPDILAAHSGYTTDLKPKINASIAPGYNPPKHEYNGAVFQIIKNAANVVTDNDFVAPLFTNTSGQFTINEVGGAGRYWVRGAATNWFVNQNYDNANWSVPVKVDILALPGGTVSQSFLLTFKRDVNSKVGINSFSMPVAPANYALYFADPVNNPAEWNAKSADDLVDLGIIRTAYDLVKAINKQVKEIDKTSIENVVSTFGEWIEIDPNDPTKIMMENGVLITDNDPGKVEAELKAIKLKPGEGYQLYLTGVNEVKIRIKN